MLGTFDTAVFLPRRGLHLFAGDQLWRYSNGGRAPDEGFPRPITAEFPGAFARNLDAALVHPDGSLHLFRGDQHIRYDIGRRRPELGYPRRYAGDWRGVFPQRIDAALTWAPDIVYVFSGDHYTSFSPRRGEVRRGFPKAIHGNWPELDGGPVRAAFNLPGDRRVLITAGGVHSFDRDGNPHEAELELPMLPDAARQTRARRTPSQNGKLGSLAQSTEAHLAEAEETFELIQRENKQTTQPVLVDTAAAVPTFDPTERTKIVKPLLAPATRQKAVDWTRSAHPASSGVDVDGIRAALASYVDVAAVTAALGPDASAEDVFVESVHQFQVKCYVDPHEHDGLAGESVLDSLGLIARSGSGMRNADRGSVDAQKRLNSRDGSVKAVTGGEFSAANWFDRMADPSVFGQRTQSGAGVHVVLLRKLRAAERHLLTLPALAGKTPAALGAALGLTEKHSGARPGDAKTSVHSFGVAIDIAPHTNPWVLSNSSWAALRRAALLVSGATLNQASAPAYFDSLGSDPTRSTGQIWDELRLRNTELRSYFALGNDAAALRSALQVSHARGTAGLVSDGESLDDAVTRWTASIRSDREALVAGDFNGYVSPDRGFLTHARDLVIALRDHGCLAWGAVDFGAGRLASGDMMHFDARIDGAGRVLTEHTGASIPTKGHPCLKATGTAGEFDGEAAQELEGQIPPPSRPTARVTLSSLESRFFPSPGGPDAAPFSRAASFEPIIDGADYFAAIAKEIAALKAGDSWWVAGWWVNIDFPLVPGGRHLGDLLVERAAAGVDVRVIVWANRWWMDHAGWVPQAQEFFVKSVMMGNIRTAEDLRGRVVSGRRPMSGRVLIDSSQHAVWAQHMKFTVFVRSGQVIVYAGGIDYEKFRLTTPTHLGKSPLHLSNWWHDAGVRTSGDAADRILQTFAARWAAAAALPSADYDLGDGKGRRSYNPAIQPLKVPHTATIRASTDTAVQVVRTLPDDQGGVREVERTFLSAIGAAQRYIYVEDQYFDAGTLLPSIANACRRGVRVIAVVPGAQDPQSGEPAPTRALTQPVKQWVLDKLSPAERCNLAVWQLAGVFVHAKVILIDDEFVSIGSANFADRSIENVPSDKPGFDSELTVAAVSTSTLVSDLRVKLWAEHLRVSDSGSLSELRDLDKGLAVWRASWGTGVSFRHTEADNSLRFVGPLDVPAAPTGGITPTHAGSGAPPPQPTGARESETGPVSTPAGYSFTEADHEPPARFEASFALVDAAPEFGSVTQQTNAEAEGEGAERSAWSSTAATVITQDEDTIRDRWVSTNRSADIEASAFNESVGPPVGTSIRDAGASLFGSEMTPAGTPTSKFQRPAAIAEATAMIARFRAQTEPGKWHASLDRRAVANRLLALINNPDLVDQTANGLCGEAAFFNVWLWEDPLAVARFGVQLYNGGAAAVGTEEWVRPRASLRAQNFDNVVTQMNRPNARAAVAEWMMMSALRDANNYVFSYDGTPSDKWGAGSSDGEVARWLRATNLFSSVTAKTGRSERHNFDHASRLVPGRDVIMISCDSHMLGNPKSPTITDDHWFVLRSAITDHGETVDFRFWSWGEPIQWVNDRRADPIKVGTPLPGDLQKTQFTAEYFGYLIAKR
jgi:phosphatidylserine/phosphatidylglycerophosphate/cardiolipin synthase-like enzyme